MSCNRYVHVNTNDGLSVFLDNFNGKLIYINNHNEIVDYIDLKESAQKASEFKYDNYYNFGDWDNIKIFGKYPNAKLDIRFYDDKLLYIFEYFLRASEYENDNIDEKLNYFSNNIHINLIDNNNFILETIEPQNWSSTNDSLNGRISHGDIPITLKNFREIYSWEVILKNGN
jgi:hypothetical protein